MKDVSLANQREVSGQTALNQNTPSSESGYFTNLVDLLEACYTKYPNNPAVTNMGATLTYAELGNLSTNFASYLQHHLKIKQGDRVAIMMPNCLQYYIALHGILRAGGVVVNINPLYTPRELAYQLNDAQCENIILMTTSASRLSEIISTTAVKNVILTQLGDFLGMIKGPLINWALKYIKRIVHPFALPQAVNFKHALTLGAQYPFSPVTCSPNDMAFLQYTGGTSGISKGAILSHANMCANVWQARTWAGEYLEKYSQVALSPLPMYHIFSLTITAFAVYSVGSHVILITDPRDIPSLIKTWQQYPVTMLTGINTLYAALLRNPDFSKLDFSTLKLAVSGGMGTREIVATDWQRVTKKCIIEGYGLTEASPVISINPIHTAHFNGTIGKALVNTETKICGDDGHSLPLGEAGELWVRGPQVMKAYWNNPQETTQVLTEDGWLKTGDICSINEEGYIKLIDRKKEMIVVSGFKVFPNEVEEVLTSHPGILEAAVIGVPDQHSGEQVKAFVVRKHPDLTAEDIMSYCRENLTGYKRPHSVVFRDALPKTNVGKVLHRVLRDEEKSA